MWYNQLLGLRIFGRKKREGRQNARGDFMCLGDFFMVGKERGKASDSCSIPPRVDIIFCSFKCSWLCGQGLIRWTVGFRLEGSKSIEGWPWLMVDHCIASLVCDLSVIKIPFVLFCFLLCATKCGAITNTNANILFWR